MTPNPRSSARRWRFASGFCVIVTFTVIVGYYVPLYREATRLRASRASLTSTANEVNLARAKLEIALADLQGQHAQLSAQVDAKQKDLTHVTARIEKLKGALRSEFSKLQQAKLLTIASAADRVSVAVSTTVLFADRRPLITPNGKSLLCQLGKSIMAEFNGQIRVTGYYGKPRILEPDLAARFGTPWELSAVRAAAAVQALETTCGAPAERFLVVGYGPRAAGPLGENIALEFVFSEGG